MFKYRNCLWASVATLIAASTCMAQFPGQVLQSQPSIVGTWVSRSSNPTCGWTIDKRVTLRSDGTCTMVSQCHGSYPSAWHSAVVTVNGTYTYNPGILKTTIQNGQSVVSKIAWQSPNQLVCQNAEQTTQFRSSTTTARKRRMPLSRGSATKPSLATRSTRARTDSFTTCPKRTINTI